jgi:integrase
MKHRGKCHPTAEGWLFANPVTDKPYHQDQIVKTHLARAAVSAEIAGKVGWHTFRGSYRSWMDDTGAPLGVQRELMRHASITTTMNIYGKAMSDSKRQAHSKVVQMVLRDPLPPVRQQKRANGV